MQRLQKNGRCTALKSSGLKAAEELTQSLRITGFVVWYGEVVGDGRRLSEFIAGAQSDSDLTEGYSFLHQTYVLHLARPTGWT